MAEPRAGFTRKAGERIKRVVEAVENDRLGKDPSFANSQPRSTYLPGRLAVLTEAIRGAIWNGIELEYFSGSGIWLDSIADNKDSSAAGVTDTFVNKVPGGDIEAGAVVQSHWLGGKNSIIVAPCVVAVTPPSTPTSGGNGQNSSLLMRRVEQYQSDRQQVVSMSVMNLGGAPPVEIIPPVPPLAFMNGLGMAGMNRVEAAAAMQAIIQQINAGNAGGSPPPAQTIPSVPPLGMGLGSGLDGMQRVGAVGLQQIAILQAIATNAGGMPPPAQTIPSVPPLGMGLGSGLDGIQRVGAVNLQQLAILQAIATNAGGTPPFAPIIVAATPTWAAAAPGTDATARMTAQWAINRNTRRIAAAAGVPSSSPAVATTEIRVRVTRCDGSTALTGVTVSLVSGVTTIGQSTTDSHGLCNLQVFGPGTYYLRYYSIVWFGTLSGNSFTVADHPVSVHAQVESLAYPSWCTGYSGPREYIDANAMTPWLYTDPSPTMARRRWYARAAKSLLIQVGSDSRNGPIDPPAPPPP